MNGVNIQTEAPGGKLPPAPFLSELDADRTVVTSTASEEGSSGQMRLLRAQQRKFAKQMFDVIQEELVRNCS